MNSTGASITMWRFIFPLLVFAHALWASNVGDARENEVNGDQGFAYSYSGSSQNPASFPFAFPHFPVYNFNALFSDYLDNLRQYHEEFASNIGNQIRAASAFANPGNIPNLASRFAEAADGQGGAASATGFIGGGQVKQTASVYPSNPASPNINSRFASTGGDGDGGSYGVFTSSFSETAPDKNGNLVTRQKASTTVNDNGKVSTYTVHNP